MAEIIVSREQIAEQARQDVAAGVFDAQRYPQGSEAQAAYVTAVTRYRADLPETDGSA